MAAKSKLTPEIQERICTLIRAGNTLKISAEAAGIAESTFYDWKRDKPEFAAAVEKAEAEAEATLVARVAKAAAAGSWRAACWLLERRNPEDWATIRPKDTGDEPDKPGVMDAPARRTSHLKAA